uniref:ribosomal protein L4 n=1 Tax=Hypnea pseudomusciformis TaxID=1545697 RepID=UPI0027DA5A35|nr:ribosomal protein L4 [Hypnea pseudomusciformis]WCH55167.1 ribosomal protein L4 [Hypnea pseudomusciformis]WCH55566.1 ribosomal protein L4 [Hypnea pseudomusciformis]WCH56760.1 ribosomal protein L4 [Hypnea pseudomusciformis]
MIQKEIKYNLHNTNKSEILKLNINEYKGIYLIHRALIQQLNNKRQGTANTKTRSEVRGGGKKPWKQKGTGRARAGSTRSPLWTGGGTIFGPKYKKYNIKINKKEKNLALNSVLYNKIKDTLVITDFGHNLNNPSTKLLLQEINQLGLNSNKPNKLLIIVNKKQKNLYLSTRNLKNIELISVYQLNLFALLKAHKIIITISALNHLNKAYND